MSLNFKKLYQKTFAEKKVLKQENQKLKEKHESRNKEFYDLLATNRGIRSRSQWKSKEVEKLFDENKELKKEIEILKKKLLILEDHAGPIDTRILYEDVPLLKIS